MATHAQTKVYKKLRALLVDGPPTPGQGRGKTRTLWPQCCWVSSSHNRCRKTAETFVAVELQEDNIYANKYFYVPVCAWHQPKKAI